MRNIFALTSVLEIRRMKTPYAENGRDGIAVSKPVNIDQLLSLIRVWLAVQALRGFAK